MVDIVGSKRKWPWSVETQRLGSGETKGKRYRDLPCSEVGSFVSTAEDPKVHPQQMRSLQWQVNTKCEPCEPKLQPKAFHFIRPEDGKRRRSRKDAERGGIPKSEKPVLYETLEPLLPEAGIGSTKIH